jgi:hypothetical protein
MKQNYTHIAKRLIAIAILLIGTTNYAQSIRFSFLNAVNTNDGTNDFYEADLLIETNGAADFKLGSGQLYFNYNEAAFGQNINANNKIEISQTNGPLGNGASDGYICGQVNNGFAPIYGGYVINDNTTSRISWAFTQVFSSSTFTGNNVVSGTRKLIHLKIEYTDVNEEPMVEFEDDNNVIDLVADQFYSACGDDGNSSGNFILADCTNFAGTQFLGAVFDNSNSVLSIEKQNEIVINQIQIYPNPSRAIININTTLNINKVDLFDLLGKHVLTAKETQQINISHLPVGVYFLKAQTDKQTITKKVIIE